MPGDLARRLHELFAGSVRSHGTYGLAEPRPGSPKLEIKKSARTVRSPATPELWQQHLDGTRPLGVAPLREDETVLWGVIDIDVYVGFDHAQFAGDLRARGLPLLPCRSKSGGCHAFIFFAEPVAAVEVREALRSVAAMLGWADSEVFPNQTSVDPSRDELSFWLNMPYFDGDTTDRYMVTPDGRGVRLSKFVEIAESTRVTLEQLRALRVRETSPGFETGPPCLETLTARGFGEGSRNNGLLALGVLAKKLRPDDWRPLLAEWNQRYMKPPLSSEEVESAVRGLMKKDYRYRCRSEPLKAVCNSALCRTRPHGVGDGAATEVCLERVEIVRRDALLAEEPEFHVHLKTGEIVVVDAGILGNPAAFRTAVLRQKYRIIPMYSQSDWNAGLQRVMEDPVFRDPPEGESTRGIFMEILDSFVTERALSTAREDLLLGRPWHDEVAGLVFFRMQDLERAMRREKFEEYDRRQIAEIITSLAGGGRSKLRVSGKSTRVYSVRYDVFSWTTAPAGLPSREESPI